MLERNNQSRFSQNPQLELQRSTFNREFTHKTTFNSGYLVPVFVDACILPGDTVTMNMSEVVRMTTPIHPVMDNANLELFWFFTPYRLIWDNFEHFITGGLDAGEWDTPTVYDPPRVRPSTYDTPRGRNIYTGFGYKSLADYMGIPVGSNIDAEGNFTRSTDLEDGVSALPFRAYAKIYNDWFRANEIQPEILIPTTDGLQTPTVFEFSNGAKNYDQSSVQLQNGKYLSILNDTTVYGGSLLRANKYHDYFTSALLEPQRGQAVGIPLEGSLPVTTGEVWSDLFSVGTVHAPMQMAKLQNVVQVVEAGSSVQVDNTTGSLQIGGTDFNSWATPANLIVNADGVGNLQISINDLRHAIAVQHILEKDARGGGTYRDQLLSHFGVLSPDARLQRSEYLGGSSIPINIEQVVQTSSTDGTSPQGNTAAFSVTANSGNVFTKSFVEHGVLMCIAVVRHVHTYQQGISKQWTWRDRYDLYFPELANISEQAILKKEIFVSGDKEIDDQVFGYQEPWAHYRYFPSIISGSFRSDYPQSLDIWHFADYYESTPYLSADWLKEGSSEIDRTLSVSSTVEDQFIADFFFKPQYYRVMPVYSVPGLDRL